MKNKEEKKRYKRYNKALLDKIDSMPMANENSPYNAVKKQTVGDKELFGNEIYHNPDEEDSNNGAISLAIVIVIMILCVGAIAFVLFKFL